MFFHRNSDKPSQIHPLDRSIFPSNSVATILNWNCHIRKKNKPCFDYQVWKLNLRFIINIFPANETPIITTIITINAIIINLHHYHHQSSIIVTIIIIITPISPLRRTCDCPWVQFSPVICLKEVIESATLNPLCNPNSY